MGEKIKRKIWDLLLIRDRTTGKLKIISFPKNDPSIWDKVKKKKNIKLNTLLKGGRI